MNEKELAEKLVKCFEQITRDDGSQYWVRKDNSPSRLKDLCFAAHNGWLPDDYKYQIIVESLENIAAADEFAEDYSPEPSVYTSDLTAWLHSDNRRIEYLNAALDEWGDDISNIGLVRWNDRNAEWESGGGSNSECSEYKTIIGNIYENHELIEL